ncbi:MAG: U32 family peptidase [Bryobacteraceae bacterium]|nr:U32 family peptidase [Bryobacteraceae bacterium]
MRTIEESLEQLGLSPADPSPSPSSPRRFPDGGQYRLEIPSTEGPASLRAVLQDAKDRNVPVHRISQGSGIMLMTDEEISEMCSLGREHSIEVNLFLGPRATFDVGAQAYALAGRTLGLSLRGADQLRFALLDVRRAVDLGVRSVLVSDIGVLSVISKMRAAGDLPTELIIKTSVMMAPCNPASARILEDLGADTINVPSDLSIPQIAAIRAALSAILDFYIEAPDNIGGFIRYYEMPEIVRVASPVYLKFGLRNSPDVYPSGSHLENTVVALSRERVRRAEIALGMLRRYGSDLVMSPLRAKDLGIPAPAAAEAMA